MSGDVDFGGTASGGSWTADSPVYSDGISLPTGRAMANGSTAAAISALRGVIGGRSVAVNVNLVLGSARVNGVPVAASNVNRTGWNDTNLWVVNGGTTRFSMEFSGSVYFGKGGAGTVTTGIGDTYSGTLGGSYHWGEAPAAPTMNSATAGPGQATVTFTGSTDTGGLVSTGLVLQYANNPAFAGATTIASTGSNTVACTPGQTYYFRAAGRNALTDAVGTYGPWAVPISVRVGIGGRRFDGTAEQPFMTAMRWDGNQEVPITTAVRWNGTAEISIT